MSVAAPCPACGHDRGVVFCEIGSVPVYCNVLLRTRAQALAAPQGDITLSFCPACGHVFNAGFDPGRIDYDPDYENSLHFSPHFQRYAERLADELIDRFDLHGRDIIEIGCGKGDFLALLCNRGQNRGLGFDASFDPERTGTATGNFQVVRDHYGPRFRDHAADLVCCRHVLEHIAAPQVFLGDVKLAASSRAGAGLYLEVPNALYTLEDLGIWDIIYEHCGYFTPQSLANLLVRTGFAVDELRATYDNQFLGAYGRVEGPAAPSSIPGPDLAGLQQVVHRFARHRADKIAEFSRRLGAFANQGKRMAVWGAGSKGVTFLNVVPGAGAVEHVVDRNPNKHGRFAPGTGHEVIAPERLPAGGVDVVLVMNPTYRHEISEQLTALGHAAELVLV